MEEILAKDESEHGCLVLHKIDLKEFKILHCLTKKIKKTMSLHKEKMGRAMFSK